MTTTGRIILIDNGSGFVWADTALLAGYDPTCLDAEHDAIAAACAIDAAVGEVGRGYEFQRANPRDSRTGYHVYQVGADFPVVTDGQDQAAIDAVTEGGRYVGFVTVVGDHG